MENKKLVIIPTYNEIKNVERLVGLVYQYVPDMHILIVDDNSPDGTGAFVTQLIETKYPQQLHLLRRAGKLGLGTAYIAGFKWALERDYEFIMEMDADFSHNPKYLPQMLAAAEKADLALGSRYVKGGGVTNWSLIRRFISLGGSMYSRIILGLRVRDLTGGFKCFRRKVLEKIDLNDVRSNGYCFQIEMTYRTILAGFKVVEVPFVFEERAAGKSKMSKKIFLEALLRVPKLRLISGSFKVN